MRRTGGCGCGAEATGGGDIKWPRAGAGGGGGMEAGGAAGRSAMT